MIKKKIIKQIRVKGKLTNRAEFDSKKEADKWQSDLEQEKRFVRKKGKRVKVPYLPKNAIFEEFEEEISEVNAADEDGRDIFTEQDYKLLVLALANANRDALPQHLKEKIEKAFK